MRLARGAVLRPRRDGRDALVVEGVLAISVAELRDTHTKTLPALFG
ncbi:hypothetical protein GCM10020219_009460 [Nonomuraea dietziae]